LYPQKICNAAAAEKELHFPLKRTNSVVKFSQFKRVLKIFLEPVKEI
jgi:hypothetical protein